MYRVLNNGEPAVVEGRSDLTKFVHKEFGAAVKYAVKYLGPFSADVDIDSIESNTAIEYGCGNTLEIKYIPKRERHKYNEHFPVAPVRVQPRR